MEQETKIVDKKCGKMCKSNASGGMVYCLGVIGAAVYYFQYADTFMVGVVGFLKALAWPAFFVYEVFKFLGM